MLTVLDVAGGVDSLDPGYWYYQTDYEDLGQTTQRQLYGWPPNAQSPTPDLAASLPSASNGGKTLTIHIRSGIKYSAPLSTRTVKASDFKYALERCAAANVGNGYAGAYFTHIQGWPATPPATPKPISGIVADDAANTLTINLTQPVGVLANGNALALPCTTPVPKDYAAKYDKGAQSSYGMHQVFTGPYMIKGAGTGTVPPQGYTANKILDLVRNPNWDKATDFRPAYLNEIVIKEGYQPETASLDVLNGTSMVSGDYAAPPPDIAQRYLQSKASQFHVQPSQSIRYIGMNPNIKPLGNINVRRAIIAATDRNALILTRGGKYIGIPATHMIPPGMPGFDQAGGQTGANDFYANPAGNLALAESYMKKAGYPSGKYTGGPLSAVGDNSAPAKQTAEAFVSQMKALGFNIQLTEVPHSTMYSKFCQVPKSQPAFCPNLAWGKDFFDSQSMLDPLLNSRNIAASGNTNTAQAKNPTIDQQLNSAASLTDPASRAQAYASIDKEATSDAYYDEWTWDNQVGMWSSNVNWVYNQFNTTTDLTATSLK